MIHCRLKNSRPVNGTTIAQNDNWGTAANATQLVNTGFAPTNGLEAAILINLPPGAYTAIVEGLNGGTGTAVAAVYEVDGTSIPLVNISILVRCGEYLDPAGQEGLASLTGTMLMRGGTAKLSATDLEEQLAFLAAHLATGVGDTSGNVSLNLLSKDLDEGLALLRAVLATPGFQEDKIDLRKRQLL